MVRVAALAGLCLATGTLAGCNQTGMATGATTASALVAAPAAEGLAGGAIGRELDRPALRAASEAERRALEFGRTGVPVNWRWGRNRGVVVPGAEYQVNTYSCRDYVHTITLDGRTESARGTACREADGDWRPVT